MEAWLSWLEHTVHIREVTGSSPVASTNAKTLLFSRVFLLSLVFATVSKVRSAPVAVYIKSFITYILKNSVISKHGSLSSILPKYT